SRMAPLMMEATTIRRRSARVPQSRSLMIRSVYAPAWRTAIVAASERRSIMGGGGHSASRNQVADRDAGQGGDPYRLPGLVSDVAVPGRESLARLALNLIGAVGDGLLCGLHCSGHLGAQPSHLRIGRLADAVDEILHIRYQVLHFLTGRTRGLLRSLARGSLE